MRQDRISPPYIADARRYLGPNASEDEVNHLARIRQQNARRAASKYAAWKYPHGGFRRLA